MTGLNIFSARGVTMAALGLAAVLGVALGAAAPAQARVFIGIGLPYYYGPAYIPPPVYYPPAYYVPPPVVYAPPQTYTPSQAAEPSGSGQTCYAGQYVCPMDRPVPSGSGCYCLGNGGQRVNGHAS